MIRLRFLSRTTRIIALCSFANFINSADRIIMPITIIPMTDIYKWTLHEQGIILSAFAFGYFTTQIIGSLWTNHFGPKNLLTFSVLLWSLTTFITPLLADNLLLLIICRIILGIAEGLGLPTIYHLFSYTIPVEERSRAFSYLLASGTVGQTVASIITPHLLWQHCFYLFGSIGFLWLLLWLTLYPTIQMDDTMITNNMIILTKWWKFFTHKSLLSIYLAHFAMNWSSYIIMQWLPTYLTRYLNADSHNLSLTAIPHIFNSLIGILSGHIADSLLIDKMWSQLNVRRLMTSIGLIGPGLFLAIFCVVDHLFFALLFVSISMGLLACNSAGHLSNHVDIATNYAGITFAISNTIATIPGILCGPITASVVLWSNGKWLYIFLSATFINLFAASVYFLYSKAVQIF